MSDSPDFPAAWQHWCEQRQHHLRSADSPLGWVGLHWLDRGENRAGSAADCPLTLPAGLPPELGRLRWTAEGLHWCSSVAGVSIDQQPAATGEWLPVRSDAAGAPSLLRYADCQFFLIEREGKLALRVKDLCWLASWPAPPTLDHAAYDAGWCLPARWQTLAEPLSIEIPTVTGDLKPVTVTGQVVTTLPGDSAERALLPMQADADGIFLVFRDAGSGRFGYGAGRFLRLAVPASLVDGTPLTLDFNYAYNPPCAFTAFAACPLPPPENWLPLAVPVGEKKFAKPA